MFLPITFAEYKIISSLLNLSEWPLPKDARFRAARGSAWHNGAHTIVRTLHARGKQHKGKILKKNEDTVTAANQTTHLRACRYNQQIFWSIGIHIFCFNLKMLAHETNEQKETIVKKMSTENLSNTVSHWTKD